MLPVSVALALGVTQLLAAGMVAPLRRMTEVSRAMARGDYSGRVRTSATDEVGQLAAAFNRMAEDLATVDRERRDLIATVSHELRTPLTAMTALLENLADGVVPADSAAPRRRARAGPAAGTAASTTCSSSPGWRRVWSSWTASTSTCARWSRSPSPRSPRPAAPAPST